MNAGRQKSIVSSLSCLQLGCICIVWVNIWGLFSYIFNIRGKCRLLTTHPPNYPVALCLKAILIIMKVCKQHACIVHACTATLPYMYILMYIVIDINNRKSCYYATMYFSFIYLRHYFSQVTITLITTPVHELNDFFFCR